MDEEYKLQFENQAIKRRLLNLENLPILEDLLDKSAQQFKRVRNIKNLYKKFTRIVKEDELDNLAYKVYGKVDDFLDFESYERPAILFESGGCTSFYHPGQSLITVHTLLRAELIPIAGHEYAHHVHFCQGLEYVPREIFMEGHARGVQKHIAESYSQKEGNEAFLYDISEKTIHELANAYGWLCKRLNKIPKDSLLKMDVYSDILEMFRGGTFGDREPSNHALGNAFCSIYESLHGKDIYKQMVHGEFKFTE